MEAFSNNVFNNEMINSHQSKAVLILKQTDTVIIFCSMTCPIRNWSGLDSFTFVTKISLGFNIEALYFLLVSMTVRIPGEGCNPNKHANDNFHTKYFFFHPKQME